MPDLPVPDASTSDASDVLLKATITCPACGAQTENAMPTESCQFFWACPSCERVLRPETGDCCVFCSYADAPCPPVQHSGSGADASEDAAAYCSWRGCS